jgi:hypothetical protein
MLTYVCTFSQSDSSKYFFFLVLLEFQKTLYAYVRNVLYVRLVIVTVGNHVF